METSELGQSLVIAYAQVPDPRSGKGLRHPLPAVLTLMTVAILSGARSLYAIAQWGRLQPPEVVRTMGFARDRTPAVSTLHEVTRRINPTALEAVLAQWVATSTPPPRGGVALDGKALR